MTKKFNQALIDDLREIIGCLTKASARLERIDQPTMNDVEALELIERKQVVIRNWIKRLENEP